MGLGPVIERSQSFANLIAHGIYTVQLHGGVSVGPPIPFKLPSTKGLCGPEVQDSVSAQGCGPGAGLKDNSSHLTALVGSLEGREVAE